MRNINQTLMTGRRLASAILIVLTGGMALLSSCTYEEEDLFDQSAAQRLNASVKDYRELLTSSQYGWVMEYWPNNGTMGGYVFTAKFSENGDVEMCGEEDITYDGKTYTPGDAFTSNYSVKSEQGTILTFDTYNPLFHRFSEPQGSSNVSGYNSDYEFVFLRASENQDTIVLRGKKYGQEMTMTRFHTDPSVYMAMRNKVTIAARYINRKCMTVNGITYNISMHMKKFIVDDNGKAIKTTYLVNDQGITLAEDVTLSDGTQLSSFKFNSETGEFVSPDYKAVILCPSLEEQFNDTWFHWFFQIVEKKEGKSFMSAGSVNDLYHVLENDALMGKSLWDLYYNNIITTDGMWGNMELVEGSGIKAYMITSLISLSFGPKLSGEGWFFGWEDPYLHTIKNRVFLNYIVTNDFPIDGAFTAVNYEVKFHCLDEEKHLFSIEGLGDIDKGDDVSGYGLWWMWMGAIVNRTYTVAFDDEHCATEATFTATDDPDFWFTLKLHKLMESRSGETSAAKAFGKSNNKKVRNNTSFGSTEKVPDGMLPQPMYSPKQIQQNN